MLPLSWPLAIYEFVVGEFPNGLGNNPKWAEIDNAMQEFWEAKCPQFLRENNPLVETAVGVISLSMGQQVKMQAIAVIP